MNLSVIIDLDEGSLIMRKKNSALRMRCVQVREFNIYILQLSFEKRQYEDVAHNDFKPVKKQRRSMVDEFLDDLVRALKVCMYIYKLEFLSDQNSFPVI